jgi:branched-chain amino acid transport system permease protein
MPFDAASPFIWGLAAVLAVGGFLVARITWKKVGRAWDEASGIAREKGITL